MSMRLWPLDRRRSAVHAPPADGVVRLGATERLLLIVVVAAGLLFRGWDLGDPVFWADEAESSINALTILDHGVPTSEYLGIPIYENTLTVPWPGHAEYEFRDSSYSRQGLPIYHGWLPLYSIAASFLLAGVTPDTGRGLSVPRVDPKEHRYRTAAARAPALLFSALFLVLAFFVGKTLCGKDAGWTCLVIAATSDQLIWAGRQARYYSATLALSVGVFFALVLVLQRGRWRDYVVSAVALSLLFHTHLLATAILAAVFCVTLPWQLRRAGAVAKLAVCAVIGMATTLPWMAWTGFLDQQSAIPRAWPLLELPGDLFKNGLDRSHYLVLLLLGCVALAGIAFPRVRPLRLMRPFIEHRTALLLIAAWIAMAFVLFFATIPAASVFPQRLSMLLQAPVTLLMGVAIACVVRALLGRPSAVLACAIALVFLHGLTKRQTVDYSHRWDYASLQVAGMLGTLPLGEQPRLYATPNGHLILTFYTGLPVQSIAPVRKEFLDAYLGDIVLFDECVEMRRPGDPLSDAGIRGLTTELGLGEGEIRIWTAELSTRIPREEYVGKVARIQPELRALPEPWSGAVTAQRRVQRERLNVANAKLRQNPLFRSITIETPTDQWQAFFYRFVDFEARRGPESNYANRMRNATAFFTAHRHWIVCHSPPPP